MGHDIVAFKHSNEDLNRMAQRAIEARLESGDLGKFEDFQKELADMAIAAAMRRSSFDRYNKVIYHLCNAEFTYGGWSGNQGEVWLDREEVDHVLAQIERMRETGVPVLSREEIQGMIDQMKHRGGNDHGAGPHLFVYKVDFDTGRKTLVEDEEERKKYIADMIDDGGWGGTCEDNLDTEFQFFTEIKTCMDQEGLEKIRLWFG